MAELLNRIISTLVLAVTCTGRGVPHLWKVLQDALLSQKSTPRIYRAWIIYSFYFCLSKRQMGSVKSVGSANKGQT